MRVCYMAHPIGGDVEGNVARAKRWLAYLQRAHGAPGQQPVRAFIAPYLHWIDLHVLDEHDPAERAHGLLLAKEAAARCDEFWPVGCSHQREHVVERTAGAPPLDLKREWVLGLSTGMYAEYSRWQSFRPIPVAEAGLHRQYLFEHEPPLRPGDLDELEAARRGEGEPKPKRMVPPGRAIVQYLEESGKIARCTRHHGDRAGPCTSCGKSLDEHAAMWRQSDRDIKPENNT